jgi:hypothetical protein
MGRVMKWERNKGNANADANTQTGKIWTYKPMKKQ